MLGNGDGGGEGNTNEEKKGLQQHWSTETQPLDGVKKLNEGMREFREGVETTFDIGK